MKCFNTLLLTVLALGAACGATTAQTLILANRITQITPSEGLPGEVITVRVAPHPIIEINRQRSLLIFGGRRLPVRPVTQTPRLPRIQFTGRNGAFVNGLNVRVLDGERYSVTVPDSARTGPMRLETISGTSSAFSTSTAIFTFVECGYAVANESQFNIVSIKVDGVEKLAPAVIQAVPSTATDVFARGIGALPGNHDLLVTIGENSQHPVMTFPINVLATTPLMGMNTPTVPAGEFLTLRREFENVTGPVFTSLWQHTEYNLDGSIFEIYSYHFEYNEDTGTTTFTLRNQGGELASGQLREPAVWPANPRVIQLQMVGANGGVVDTLEYDITNKIFRSTGLNVVFTRS